MSAFLDGRWRWRKSWFVTSNKMHNKFQFEFCKLQKVTTLKYWNTRLESLTRMRERARAYRHTHFSNWRIEGNGSFLFLIGEHQKRNQNDANRIQRRRQNEQKFVLFRSAFSFLPRKKCDQISMVWKTKENNKKSDIQIKIRWKRFFRCQNCAIVRRFGDFFPLRWVHRKRDERNNKRKQTQIKPTILCCSFNFVLFHASASITSSSYSTQLVRFPFNTTNVYEYRRKRLMINQHKQKR